MRETFILTKVLLKNGFRSSDKRKNKILGYLAIVIYFSVFTIYISQVTLQLLADYALEYLFIQILLLFNVALILMQSIVSSLNMFFFSNDLEYILPFPIKEKNLYKAKLNLLVVSEYIFEILFFLAPFTYYGIFMGQNFLYYLKMLIVMTIIPVICCAIIAFIMVRIVSLCKFLKNKDVVQYMSIIMAIVFILLISVFSSGENGNGISNDQILNTVFVLEESVNSNIVISSFINIFKDFLISNEINVVLSELFKIIIFTWGVYFGFTAINSKVYKRNLSINFNNGKKEKKIKDLNKKYSIIKRNVGASYIKKEWNLLIRVPAFFMQCIVPVFIVPIIIFMPFIININDLEVLDLPSLDILKENIITREGISVILILMQILYLMNINAVTAVSRDNNNAVFMKYIPVSFYKQCVYKIMPGVILNMVPNIYLVIVLKFIFSLKIYDILMIIVTLVLINIFESFCLILLDLRKPKINWDSENTVVKQNMNIIIGYFVQIAICFISVMIIIVSGKNVLNTLILLDVIFIVSLILLNLYFKKNERKIFSKIY